jgi:hypothetical protein
MDPETTWTPPALGCAQCGDCCQNIPCNIHPDLKGAPGSDVETNIRFIRDHWTRSGTHPDGTHLWNCDQFDPVHRLCLAQDAKPPICRDYPWYHGKIGFLSENLQPKCSYLLDVPPDRRPARARPLIPVEVIRRPPGAAAESDSHKDCPNHDQ